MRTRLVLLALAAVSVVPASLRAQAESCQLVASETLERRTDGTFQTINVVAPVVQCTGGARISANSGTIYAASNEVHLFGNVVFSDPERRLTSDNAVYTSVTGRLWATGNVVFIDNTQGTTLRGPELEYFRAMRGRPQSQSIATGRPHLTLMPRPRPGSDRPADTEPIEVDADRMVMIGNEQFNATGRVEITRSDFRASSREARMDQVANRMELRGAARVFGEQYDLSGDAIDVFMPEDRLERVLAQRTAELVGDDLRLDAPEIQLFFADDQLQRMAARIGADSTQRAIATARGFRLEADSIDARIPAQQLEQVVAVGRARGESLDTTNVPTGRIARAAAAGDLAAADRDWILGDTVTGFFVAVAPEAQDTTAAPVASDAPEPRTEVVLDRVLAVGSARSLYRVESNREGTDGRRGINYIVGEAIALTFRDGEIDVADVRGLHRGLFLDPEAPAAAPAEDGPETPATGPVARGTPQRR